MPDPKNSPLNNLASDMKRGWMLSDDDVEKTQIGGRIRTLRQSRGDLTLDQLSELTKLVDPFGKGISRVSLSRYETGAAFPGVREIKILARALRATVALLLYGDADDPMNFFGPSIDNVIQDIVHQVLVAKKIIESDGDVGPLGDDFLSLVKQVKG